MLESNLVKRIKKKLQTEIHGFYVKIHGGPFQTAGLPDLVGCVNGKFIGIEVKLPGKERNLTPRQSLILQSIRDTGGIAFVATNPQEAVDMLHTYLKS